MRRVQQKRQLAWLAAICLSVNLLGVGVLAEGETENQAGSHLPIPCPVCQGDGFQLADCETCGGSGTILTETTCSKCKGEGHYYDVWAICTHCNNEAGKLPDGTDCPYCYGFGYEPRDVDCTVCSGTGVRTETTPCADCGGTGSQKTDVPCSNCGGVGATNCDGSFTEALISVADDGTGTVQNTCEKCGAVYQQIYSASETAVLLAERISVSFSIDKNIIYPGQTWTGTIQIGNQNPVDVASIQVELAGLDSFVDVSTNDSHIKKIEEGMMQLALSLTPGEVYTVTVTGTAAEVMSGSNQNLTLQGIVQVNDAIAELQTMVQTVHINAYAPTKTLYLNGALLGTRYDPVDDRPIGNPAAQWLRSKKVTNLDDLQSQVTAFTWEGLKNAGFTGLLTTENPVQNDRDLRVWTCVGFVPCPNDLTYDSGLYALDDLQTYVYTDDAADFQGGGRNAAEAAVLDAGGVLYGEQNPERIAQFLRTLEEQILNESVGMNCVWYAAAKQTIQKGDYVGTMMIQPVDAVEYKPSSQGVTVTAQIDETSPKQENGHTYFDGDITVTLDKSVPEKVQVNLTDALQTAAGELSSLHQNAFQPGDTMRLSVKVINESGQKYRYAEQSAKLGTIPYHSSLDVLGTGFEGYPITIQSDYAMLPNRQLNAALQALGASDTSDAEIGSQLKKEGYGEGTSLTDEQITKMYLGCYYLDYFNQFRDTPVKSFQELTDAEFAVLARGEQGGAVETCQPVAEALYYLYYGRAVTVNDVSIYEQMASQMKDNDPLNTLLATAWTTESPSWMLVVHLDGELMGNVFQNTTFGFGMQFSLEQIPEEEPPAPPTPTPPSPSYPDDDDDDTPPIIPPAPPSKPEVPVEIPEEPTPLEPLPIVTPPEEQPENPPVPVIDLPDEEIPSEEVPETGDTLWLWIGFVVCTGVVICIVLYHRKHLRK